MYDIGKIKKLVENQIEGKDIFLVEVSVKGANKIHVIIDRKEGIMIDDCVALSRFIESNLDREAEDFELEVSSAGITSPFKVERQYEMNIGNEVEVMKKEGEKISGTLVAFDGKIIEIETKLKKKVEGKKKKQEVIEKQKIEIINIKSIKRILSI